MMAAIPPLNRPTGADADPHLPEVRIDVRVGTGRATGYDLTRGEFRWGKRPEDLAAKVKHGIPPAGMPGLSGPTDLRLAWRWRRRVLRLDRPAGSLGAGHPAPQASQLRH